MTYKLIGIILALAAGFAGQNTLDALIGVQLSDLGVSSWKVVIHNISYMVLGALVGVIIMQVIEKGSPSKVTVPFP